MSTTLRKINEVRELQAQLVHKDIDVYYDKDTKHLSIFRKDGTEISYNPLPTGLRFHHDHSFVRFVMGPFGSGKSSMCLMEILQRAISLPKCIDGVRRYRCAIIRNTMGELESTTLKTWLTWFDNVGIVHSRSKPMMTYSHTIFDDQGKIDIEMLFMGLDHIDDAGKLRSLDLTDCFINEASEIPQLIFDTLTARTGRYPNTTLCPAFKLPENKDIVKKVIMDSNPPDEDHWLYKTFEETKPPKYMIFKQPPGLILVDGKYVTNPNAENIEHLVNDYYVDMAINKRQEYIKVFCLGQYGTVIKDKPVYSQFNDDVHVMDNIEIDKKHGIYIAWDFGLTPACLIGQYIDGQVRAIKEFVTERSYIRELANDIVKPWLSTFCQNMDIYSSDADPAGLAGHETDGQNSIKILNELGIVTVPARTNEIEVGIDAVVSFLTKFSDGKPAYVVSRKGCPTLLKGFRGAYHYKRVQVIGQDKFKDVPDKIHPFSDIHDCNRYFCLRLNTNIAINKPKKAEIAQDIMQSHRQQYLERSRFYNRNE